MLVLATGSPFDGLYNAMGHLLAWFYAVIPSYGVAIVLLTVGARLVLFPLTAKQAKSMLAMQRVAPEIKKLQAKYKDDRQKLNEEMMKFYKENKINPFGGCLPLLVQMPIFFALFRVLEDMKKHVPRSSQIFHDMCHGASYAKCAKHPSLPFLGMDLSLSAGRHHSGFGDALPYFVLVALVMVTTYFQQRQTTRYTTQTNPQMQMIGRIMPIVFGFISINLPAGVVLYFFVSNVWQIGQQELVYRGMGHAGGAAAAAGPGPPAQQSDRSPSRDRGLGRFSRPAAGEPSRGESGGNGKAGRGTSGSNGAGGGSEERPRSTGGRQQGRRRSNKKRKR